MSTTEDRPTGNVPARTLITVLAAADLAACAMIGRAVQRVVAEQPITWTSNWTAGVLLASAALALPATVWLGVRAWHAASPRRWWLLAACGTGSLALWAAAVWLVLSLLDHSY